MHILIPLLVAIVGALTFALSSNPKIGQLALWAWGAGLLATLLLLGNVSLRLLPT